MLISNFKAFNLPNFRKELKRDREYREIKDETPSHTGGVSEEARRREEERRKKEERGITYDSRNKDRDERKRDRNNDRDRKRDRYDRDQDRDRDRYRDEDRDRYRRKDRGDRSGRHNDWEHETPRSDRGMKDDTLTPLIRVKNTPGHAGWEEDDTPSKLSSWDLPTPNSGRRDDDSIRSSDWRSDKFTSRRDKFNRYKLALLM